MSVLPPPDSAEMLDVITRHIGATVSVYDRDLIFRYVSRSFANFFGVEPEDMIGHSLPEFYGPEVFAGYRPNIERALAGETLHYERLLVSPSGEQTWRTVSLVPWRDEDGYVIGVVNSAHNVHQLKSASEALRVANQRLMGHMHNSPLALVEFNEHMQLVDFSPRAEEIFGYRLGELRTDPLDVLIGRQECSGEELRLALELLQRGEQSSNRAQASHLRKDGSRVHCEWFNSALTDARGRISSIMCLIEDVSVRVQAQEQLRFIAEHDSLTGLPNRAALHRKVEEALTRARRTQECLALLFIDLDGFKHVNDTFGHGAGDEALRQTSMRLRKAVRDTDTVARLGGDEFVALLEGNVRPETPMRVCERILAAMEPLFRLEIRRSDPAMPSVVEVALGASIGVAVHPPLESHVDSLFKRADEAMYAAKRAGKGRVCLAE